MSVELVLEDLKKQFGDRKVLYARDIAVILGQRQDRVRRLLNSRSLPLKLIDVGGHRGVSLYEMAQWLAEGEPQGLVSGHPADESDGKRRTRISRTKDLPSPGKDGVTAGDTKSEAGTSLVAKIMSMRHDAASFIVDQVSVTPTLTEDERHFWWLVIKNLGLDRGDVPGLVLKVVRVACSAPRFEQNTTLRVYDVNQLESALKDVAGFFSDETAMTVRVTLRDEAARRTLLKAIRDGQKRFFVTDKVGFTDSLRAALPSRKSDSGGEATP